MPGKRPAQLGMTLIEMLIAVVIGAIVLAALNSVVSLGLKAQASGRQRNEILYQARFALERMVTIARSLSPRLPPPLPDEQPGTNTTGKWLDPVKYCRNATSQLIETTPADGGCTGTTVIASNVSAFSAQPISSPGPVDRPAVALSLTLDSADAPQTVTLSTSVRIGGGTK